MIIPHQEPALNISLWKRNRDTETVILWNSDRRFKNARVLKSFRAICKDEINAGWIFWVFKNKFFLELYFFGDISWGSLACLLHLVQCWNHPSGSCYHNAQSNYRVSFPVYQYKIARERKLNHFFLRLFSRKNPSKSSIVPLLWTILEEQNSASFWGAVKAIRGVVFIDAKLRKSKGIIYLGFRNDFRIMLF